jgi:hypothetical protein
VREDVDAFVDCRLRVLEIEDVNGGSQPFLFDSSMIAPQTSGVMSFGVPLMGT